jgi:beta-phosphoglucomutase-like phosphatase (HAD superfamily)
MRVAFDIDGVVADLQSALVREAEVLFGRTLTITPEVDEDHPLDGLSHHERQRLWRRIATIENFWETLEETEEGAVARIAAVASTRRWEVLFITKRPATAGAAAQTQTQRWLCDKGFPLPAVYVVRRSRGAIAEALGLDAVVDDQLANCLDVVADSHARPLLLCRHAEPSGAAGRAGPAVTRPAPVTLVRSINGCLDVLEAMDSEVRSQKSGVWGRPATSHPAA